MGRGRGWRVAVYGLPALAYMYTVGSVGFWLPLYAADLGFSYTEIQLLATVYFAVITPATLAAGALADYTGRPGMLAAAGMALNAVSVAAMPLLHSPGALMAVRIVQALGLSTAFPVALGALSLALGVRRGVGSASLLNSLGMALGSLAGGLLVGSLGYAPMFYSSVAVSVAAAIAALAVEYPRPPRGPGLLEALRRVPWSVWAVLAGLVARNTLATGVYSVLAVVFRRVVGLDVEATAVALSVNPVVQAAASMPMSRAARGRELGVYSLGLASTALVFHLYLSARGLPGVLAAQVVQGLSFSAISVAGNMYIISRSPREIRYTASSLFGLAFNLGWVTGTLAAGPYMDAYGPEAWIGLASRLIPVVAAATYLSAKTLEYLSRSDSSMASTAVQGSREG